MCIYNAQQLGFEKNIHRCKNIPKSSKKYQETVCTAGIMEDGEWIRLYPINFRSLHTEKKYEKYSWVKTKIKPAEEAISGRRIDSFKPDIDSWEVINAVGPEKDWSERKRIIYPTCSRSIEELQHRFETERKSLGIFKPKQIYDLEIKRNDDSSRANHSKIVQMDLFEDPPKPLEDIPYEFRYKFVCNDNDCHGHSMIILDWEIYEAFRKWKKVYGEDGALQQIKRKWLSEICGADKDTHLVVGTDNRFNKFMIIGVFWPKLAPYQTVLF